MDWQHFVAYSVFIVATFIWIQSRRSDGRLVTAVGVLGLFAAFWAVLRLAR